jgi:hypothetical protein
MATQLTAKICSACKADRPISYFGKANFYKDGHRNQCNPCRSKRQTEYNRTIGREKYVEYHRLRYSKLKASLPPEGFRWEALRKKYGVTQADYETMLAAQNGRCAICATDNPRGRYSVFVVDHCHETGKVRGLLCSKCNIMLGRYGDSLKWLKEAMDYLNGTFGLYIERSAQ